MPIAVGEANKILDAWTGRTTYTANAATWAKLHTGDPGAAGTANAATSATRKQVTWAAATGGAIASNAATTWLGSDITATETVTHLSYWTASTGGTYLGSAPLGSSAALTPGEGLSFASGALTFTLTLTKMSDAEKNKALDAWAGNATYTANAGFFTKLHTGDPGAAGTANAATETTRKATTFGTAAAGGAISNTAALTWSTIAATGSETLSWLSFWTTLSGGSFLGRDDLATSRTVTAGDTFDIATGDLDLTVT